MRVKHLLESTVSEQIEHKRINEVTQLLNEYDSLDSMLIENKSYDRDVQIVVRLDELGVFDNVINEKTVRQQQSAKRRTRQKEKNKTKLPPGVNIETPTDTLSVEEPVSTTAKSSSATSGTLSRLFGKGKDALVRAGKMLATAVKSGNQRLIAKVKAVVNKMRGQKPNAPVSDVPGISPDVAAQVASVTATPVSDTDSEVTAVAQDAAPTGGQSTTEPAAEPETANTEEPTAGVSSEEPNSKVEEPKDTVSPETKDRLQTLAGIKPEEPTPTSTEPTSKVEEPATVEPSSEESAAEEPKIAAPTLVPTLEKPKVPVVVDKRSSSKPEPKTSPTPSTVTEPASEKPSGVTMTDRRSASKPDTTPEEPTQAVTNQPPASSSTTPKPDSTSSRTRPKFAPRWMEPKTGIRDRLKTAWKGFTATAGDELGKAGGSYQNVFREVQQLMREYQIIEGVLQEQSLYEGLKGRQRNLDVAPPFGKLTKADFEKLRRRSRAIREALAEQIVREELYTHGTTLKELNENQRRALMSTVKSRCEAMFSALREENPHVKLGALTGPAEPDAEGNLTVTLTPQNEQYTLEEWMGMMEEAGVNLSELSPELKARYMDKAASQVSQNLDKVQYNKQRVGGSGFDQVQRAAKDAKRIKGMTTALGSMDKQLQQRYNNPQGNTDAEKAAHQKSTVDTFDRAADNLSRAKEYSKMVAESINENTVARLQSLTGIKPTE